MFKIALRNILRNRRRTLMTALSIIVGTTALILVGEYNAMIRVGMETGLVRSLGHLGVFQKGYFEYGGGSPAQYSIADYRHVIDLIRNDPEMKAMVTVVTPRVALGGIAGSAVSDRSKTFFGRGVVPADQNRMNQWDGYGVSGDEFPTSGLTDSDPSRGVVGVGLARILGLCTQTRLQGCPASPAPAGQSPIGLAPQIQLLSGGGGAPNVVNLTVARASGQGAKEADDSYVGLHFTLAQQLLYGGGEHKAVSIAIQLRHTADMARAKARLQALFAVHHLDLDTRDFNEMYPMFRQILGYFMAIVAFLGVVMTIIVAFAVANTMSMSVMERTNEIGTARAMGVRRSAVRRQFLVEGAMLGALGAGIGLVVARLCTILINHAHITYTPPGNSAPVNFSLLTTGTASLQVTVWIVLTLIAMLASILPATRAAHMNVVDALRHI